MTSWRNNNTLKTRRLIEEVLDPVEKSEKVVAKDLEHLRALIYERIKDQGFKANLNDIDTSNITDMSQLFSAVYKSNGEYDLLSTIGRPSDGIDFSRFDGDISQWDVSNVEKMWATFAGSKFNGDISKWDVSKVRNMGSMFEGSSFNGDISNWDVSSLVNAYYMFYGSDFSGDISGWNVSNVKDMTEMFRFSPLEGKEPSWYKE